MTTERLQIAQQLVAEQLAASHIKSSVSPWNTPIFVIPKKSGKWGLLHDLRQRECLFMLSQKLQSGWASQQLPEVPLSFLIVSSEDGPFAVICQWQKKKGECDPGLNAIDAIGNKKQNKKKPEFLILEWIFLPALPPVSIYTQTEAIGAVIRKGQNRTEKSLGHNLQTSV
ncbi:hypothetical protein HGM15179_014637 [Zosterops borbonicus]|uniref:Uncharacterized protein n=1 Tax=Zosterops borbonicus TaxID=364589 RepID=A0A8K1G6D7_9PASS|nr:hypothetical protein HGM15179_014637 [Zosterops borbonicus]